MQNARRSIHGTIAIIARLVLLPDIFYACISRRWIRCDTRCTSKEGVLV